MADASSELRMGVACSAFVVIGAVEAALGVVLIETAVVDAPLRLLELCQRARAEGVLIADSRDDGPPVGLWAFLRDPDGHTQELSYGQEIGLASTPVTP